MARASGILLHPTSIPGRFGIGDLGGQAYEFVDFLADAKQKLWQILPLGPTSLGDSPYQCLSSLAGNTALINLELLRDRGYLSEQQLAEAPDFSADKVDFSRVIHWKLDLLRIAYQNFLANPVADEQDAFQAFCRQNADWLEDFVACVALKNAHGGSCWADWPLPLRSRQEPALGEWKSAHRFELDFQRFLQFEFSRQWSQLKAYANAKGISVIGDIPIFVAYDSADVWANQGLFELDPEGRPCVVAGVPPDYFSATGQRWGNPLYRWDVMAQDDYLWWRKRIMALMAQVDCVRIDHFRAFESYWEIPAASETAINGRWVKGPGLHFFQKVKEHCGDINIIAEDLGIITDEVDQLREQAGLPGMRVMQFAFGGDNDNFLPANYIADCVAYTGTHDNNTTRGWFKTLQDKERDHVFDYFGKELNESNITAEMCRALWASKADTVIIPLQDALNLGDESRMNMPGVADGNWSWRYREGQLTKDVSDWLAQMTGEARR